MQDPILLTASHPSVNDILSGIVAVHCACILTDHTLATFMPPLNEDAILLWWKERLAEVESGARAVIVQLTDRTIVDDEQKAPTVAGVVSLMLPFSQTGPHRGIVEKLFTHPAHRSRGVARGLMRTLEVIARQKARWLLLLDTETESPARQVYPRLGFVEVGGIPDYGYSPKDGRLVHETFFYKDLRQTKEL